MKEIKRSLIVILLAVVFSTVSIYSQLVGPVVSLTGNIFNEITKQPVTVFIMVLDSKGKRINATRSNAADNGYYYIAGLKPGEKYTIVLRQKHYFKEQYDLAIANSDKYQEISKDFLVKPLKKDAEIELSVPPFELNKSKLRFGAEFLLEDMKNTLNLNSEVKFKIKCYPDKYADQSENLQLTTARANSLKEYFVSSGIDPSRITTEGSKTTDPNNPPPKRKKAKGKRYIGPSYIVISDF